MRLHLMKLVCLCCALVVTACVSNVDFSKGRSVSKPNLHTVQVFFDKQGDIYPADWLESGGSLIDNSDHSLSCGYSDELCSATNTSITSSPVATKEYTEWRFAQQAEVDRIVNEIVERLRQTSTKKVVFLIHGFRVSNAFEDYGHIKERLMRDNPGAGSPVFVELHWDGRKSPTLPFSALRAWPQAQWTAPAVGYRSRPILNKLFSEIVNTEQDADLLVVTHSTGAVIAGSIFGNPSAALPCLTSEGAADNCGVTYSEFLGSLRNDSTIIDAPKWPNTTLAMLAAATTASTFATPNGDYLGYQGHSSSHLFISHSENDSALIKYIDFPSFLGYSGLGARIADLRSVEKILESKSPERAEVTILEMSNELGKLHELQAYLQTKNFAKVVEHFWATDP